MVMSVGTWTDLHGILGKTTVRDCLETPLSRRCSRETKLGFLYRQIKAPLMAFPEMPLLLPAGKYKSDRQESQCVAQSVVWEESVQIDWELQKRGTEGACAERKNFIQRKSKPGFWHLELKSFRRGVFNSFLKAECRVQKSTQFGMMHFLGVKL